MNLKKTIILILKLLISGSLLYYVLSKAGIEKVTGMLMSVRLEMFALAVAIFMLLIFLGSLRWQQLLHDWFPVKVLFPLYMLGAFFNTFLPGVVGGDIVKIYYLYKRTGKGADSVASVFMDRYIGYCAMMTVALVAYLPGYKYLKGTPIETLLPAFIAAFTFGSIAFFWLQLGRRWSFLSDIYGYFNQYKSRRKNLIIAFAYGLCIQAMNVILVYVLTLALRIEVPLLALYIFVPIIATISALPLSISGLGIREFGFVLLLGTIGISAESATAVSFLWFITLAAGGAFGAVEYIKTRAPEPQNAQPSE